MGQLGNPLFSRKLQTRRELLTRLKGAIPVCWRKWVCWSGVIEGECCSPCSTKVNYRPSMCLRDSMEFRTERIVRGRLTYAKQEIEMIVCLQNPLLKLVLCEWNRRKNLLEKVKLFERKLLRNWCLNAHLNCLRKLPTPLHSKESSKGLKPGQSASIRSNKKNDNCRLQNQSKHPQSQ